MSRLPHEASLLPGLDWLRVIAIGMVTFQHCASLTNRRDLTLLGPVNAGQLGVAIFLSISALLGAASSRDPCGWLVQRLRRIYPAYWAAMLLSFFLAWVTGYKSFTTGQFLSQMLGLGLFTHPGQLINVPTWFVSILLICYAGLFAARLTSWPGLVSISIAVAACWWCFERQQNWPWMHLATFFVTAAIVFAGPSEYRTLALSCVGFLALTMAWFSKLYAYVGISLLLLSCLTMIRTTPRPITILSSISYEYYLVHGIALVGAVSLFRNSPRSAIALGILGAFVLACLLHIVVKCALQLLERRLTQTTLDIGVKS